MYGVREVWRWDIAEENWNKQHAKKSLPSCAKFSYSIAMVWRNWVYRTFQALLEAYYLVSPKNFNRSPAVISQHFHWRKCTLHHTYCIILEKWHIVSYRFFQWRIVSYSLWRIVSYDFFQWRIVSYFSKLPNRSLRYYGGLKVKYKNGVT